MEQYAIVNCVILDGTRDMVPQRGKAILVRDGVIGDIVEESAVPKEYDTVNLDGCHVMPGLCNLHVHLAGSGKPKKKASDPVKLVKLITGSKFMRRIGKSMVAGYAKTQLFSGVTTIRTVGGIADFDSRTRDAIRAGKLTGPRILASNMAISVPDGHMAGSLGYIANSPAEAAAYVDKIAESGADLIKLMITGGVLDAVKKGEPGVLKMEPEVVRAACDRAHALGLKVAAHTESTEGVRVALENGVDTIEHGAKVDEEILNLFREWNASLVTTISPALPFALFDQNVSHATDMQKYNGRVVFDGVIDCARQCLAAGVPVGLGTDTACPYVTQYDMWRELNLFRRYCGGSGSFALHTATLVNAQIAGVDKETGSITPGKSADFLVTRESPLDNLTVLREIEAVFIHGKRIQQPKVKKIPQVEQELDNYL